MAAGKVIQAVLRLQDNMSGGILKAARNAKKAGADINNDMMQATRQVVAWKNKFLGGIADVTKKLATVSAATATAAIGGFFALDNLTEEYRVSQAKLNTAFQSVGMTTDNARTAYNEFYKILGDNDTATEASQLLASLTSNERDLLKWTNIAAGVCGKWGDSLPIEGLIEACNETVRTGTITGVLADAMNWAGKEGETFGVKLKASTKANEEWNKAVKNAESAEDYFNLALQDCATQEDRANLIMQTLTGTYSDAADAFWENNKAITAARVNQTLWNSATAKLGETSSRVKGSLLQMLGASEKEGVRAGSVFDFLQTKADVLADKLNGWMDAGKADEFAAKLDAGLATALERAGQAFDWCKEHSEGLKNALKTLVGVFAGIKTANFATGILNTGKTLVDFGKTVRTIAMTALPDMTGVVQTAIGPLDMNRHHTLIGGIKTAFSGIGSSVKTGLASVGKFIAANPVVLVIAGIVTACVLLYRHSEKFRNFVNNLVSSIKAKLAPALESAKEFFGTLVEKFKTDVIPFLKKVGDKAAELGGQLIAFLAPKIKSIIEWVKQLANSFSYWIAPAFQAFKQIAETVGKVFQTSIAPAFSKMMSALGTLAGTVLTYAVPAVKKLVEIGVKIATAYTATVVPILGRLLGVLVKIAGWVIEHVVPAVAGFISIATTLANKLIEFVSPAVSWLAEKISELAGWITAHVVPAVGGFLDEARKLATALGNTLLNAVQWLIDKFTALKNFLMKTLGPVINFIKDAFDAVRQTVGKLIDKVKEFLGMDTKKTVEVNFRETVQNAGYNARGLYLQTGAMGNNALGTDYWRGGLTRVNERGGEIMNLPSGTQIIPHDISEKMVGGNTNNINITVNVSGMDVRNPRQLGEIVVAEIMRQIHNTP